MTKADIAREYRLKYGMKMPTLTLARIMYNDNKEAFTNVEDARTRLRYIEGKNGDKNRKQVVKREFVMTEERPRNPYKLPESEETKYEPYFIKEKKIAVLSDVHIPYHSIEALTACFDFLKSERPNAILLNGTYWTFIN